MSLTPASVADLPALVELVNAAYRGGAGWTHEADYLEGVRTTLEAITEEHAAQPGALLLYRHGPEAELIGCVRLEPAAEGAWFLGLLSVRPGQQDQGVGRLILEAAETLARERGGRLIRMKVVNIRDTLIAWYGRRGYALTGETQPFPYHDDRFGRPQRDDLCFVVLEKAL